MENKIEILAPDNKHNIQLTEEQAENILLACGLYVGAVESYYPDVHADIMHTFCGCSERDPDFKETTREFIITMCRHGFPDDRKGVSNERTD